jgi:hypothetical protein
MALPPLALVVVTLAGCEINPVRIGPVEKIETIWARMGTCGKVVSETHADVQVEVIVGGKTETKRARANIQGMIVIDEPTYNLLKKHWDATKPKPAAPAEKE